jgi:hypothetical protein
MDKWRGEHPEILPDLGGAHLSKTNLSGAHLHFAHLTEADLNQTTYPVEIVAYKRF